jgi:hypothetical protein
VAGATIVPKTIALGNPSQNCFRSKSLTCCVSASGDALWASPPTHASLRLRARSPSVLDALQIGVIGSRGWKSKRHPATAVAFDTDAIVRLLRALLP